jgi:hypothetical protein
MVAKLSVEVELSAREISGRFSSTNARKSLCPTVYFSPFNFPKFIQISGIIPKKLLIPEH